MSKFSSNTVLGSYIKLTYIFGPANSRTATLCRRGSRRGSGKSHGGGKSHWEDGEKNRKLHLRR